jgi:CheY-like chemotaxis protein
MTTILIVDDSWLTRRFVSTVLEAEGYELLEADNGEDALATMEKKEINCLLLDLLMPGIDGYSVMGELKKKKSDVPVIVLTADIQKTTHAKCRELGAFKILVKPSEKEDIRQAVADALRRGKDA